MVSVAQLFSRDFPEVRYPDGRDLLQIFWCPNDHFIEYPHSDFGGPDVALLWLNSSTKSEDGGKGEGGADVQPVEDSYLIRPCLISPERVTEFPDSEELPPGILARLKSVDQRVGLRYQYELSIARGWKVGGWPSWHSTDKHDLACPDCEGGVDFLFKADSSEWDGASERWWPLEDRNLDRSAADAAYRPTGAEVGRFGELRIFVCRTDVRHPPVLDIQ